MMISATQHHAPAALPPLDDQLLWEDQMTTERINPEGALMDNPYGDVEDALKELGDADEWNDLLRRADGATELSVVHELACLDIKDRKDFCDPTVPLPNPANLESLVTKELIKMTFEQQEKAAFDVHGFSMGLGKIAPDAVEVTPEEEAKLVQLDKELRKLKVDPSNKLLRQRDYRLMFLRCEELDVKTAAQRMIKNMETKRKMFGEDTVDRYLLHSDLDEADLRVLATNYVKVSPQRDSAGRYVMIHVPDARPHNVSQRNCFKAKFYIFSLLAQDPQVQRHGMVVVVLVNRAISQDKKDARATVKFFQQLKAGMPRKISAVHFCMDTGLSNPDRNNRRLIRLLIAAAQLLLRPSVRERFRNHIALRETIHFQLKSYGILVEESDWPTSFPPPLYLCRIVSDVECSDTSCYTSGAEESDASFSSASTRMQENSTGLASSTLEINEKDVLLGRGKHTRNHPGNINAATLVNAHRSEYDKAKKFEKTAIAERIVHMIQAQGGRFLKEEKGEWVVVDAQTARNKISHLYRNTKKKFLGLK